MEAYTVESGVEEMGMTYLKDKISKSQIGHGE